MVSLLSYALRKIKKKKKKKNGKTYTLHVVTKQLICKVKSSKARKYQN